MESEPTLLQFRSLDSLIAERERHQFNQRNQQIQLNQHSQSPTSMNTTSEISDTIVPWWEDPMTDELRQLLYLDHRCFYCRAKCDSTNPPHTHKTCPGRAKKAARANLREKLAHLNAQRVKRHKH